MKSSMFEQKVLGAPEGYKPMYDEGKAWTELDIIFDDETEQK